MGAVTSVRTIDDVAQELGIDVDTLADFAYPSMDPEHGRIWIYDLDRAIQGFTPDGVEHLKELLGDLRPDLLRNTTDLT